MSRRTNFITDMIDADLKEGRHTEVVTRFPPEPNGYLHIGHAKSICLNFGLAEQYNGRCHLRYDDTNPITESVEYVEAIARDVKWLGFDWGEHRYFASDYFEQMYQYAMELIDKGLAYVDHQTLEQIRENRGTVSEPGTPSPYRDRSVEENRTLFAKMRAGEFQDGACVLRAKIDMSAQNMLLRDPVLYRVKHATHHRTGDAWPIYPMYDFAHCIEDAIEHITHSLCTLEFDNNRAIYDWILDNISAPSRPYQTEFARMNLEYTIVSKRKLLQLVETGVVEGWDDPRMPTVAGLRRRGVTPAAIRQFAEEVGVTRNENRIDIARLEHCVRNDLNHTSPRVLAVLDPLKVTITTLNEGEVQWVDADLWPHDVPKEGTRRLPITREMYIERSDFSEDPPKGWRRLQQGGEVRLRHGYIIRCEEVVRDADGKIIELRCTHDPDTLNAEPKDGRKVRGVIHWVSATEGVPREVRLYDRLFSVADPEADEERTFLDFVNPDSLKIVQGWIEPAFADAAPESHLQFERNGYFYVDPVSTGEGPTVFHRVVTLRDSWSRAQQSEDASDNAPRSRRRKDKPSGSTQAADRLAERRAQLAEDAVLNARYEEITALQIGEEDAWVLANDSAAYTLFQDVREHGASPLVSARWIVNELPRARDEHEGESALTATALAKLIDLIAADRLTGAAARELLVVLISQGGDPETLMRERGLERIDDDSAVLPFVEAVIQAHPKEVEQYQAGNQKLIGFFIGQVMKSSHGRADAGRVRALLQERLKTSS